ncbi:hypothetical protein Mpsy_0647 [Methanolobus psychrophilus R15]|nr:hypothetical protein Mpsy_0647 [Methanolobus psychrophilus R15]
MVNNNYNPEVYKSILYEDSTQFPQYLSKSIHDSRMQGLGKSYDVIQKVIKNRNKNNLVIAPFHDLLDEYVTKFTKAGVENVKIIGYEKSCLLMQNVLDKMYKDIKKMHQENNLSPSTICRLIECGLSKDCPFKQAWTKYIEFREVGTPITVLIPMDLIIVFDFRDFDNIFVDEVNERPLKLKFSESNIIDQLTKLIKIKPRDKFNHHETMHYIKDEEMAIVIQAIIDRNTAPLFKYKNVLENTIYLHNEYLITTKLKAIKNKLTVAKQLCNLRISTIITYLEFYNRKARVEQNNLSWRWECLLENGLRQLAAVANEPNALCLQHDIVDDMIVEGAKCGFRLPTFNYMYQFNYDENPFDAIDAMRNYEVKKVEPITLDIELQFHELMMYKQLDYFKTITYIDATFAKRKSLYKELILQFKELFPEYTCICEIIEQDAEINSNIWIPKNFNCKFNKSDMQDDLKAYQKIIQNKITYLKNLGKKICILTYQNQIKKDDKTLFGCPALHFGSAGGINKFENNDVLFVIGTYRPPEDWFRKQWNLYYAARHGEMPSLRWIVDEKNRTSYPSNEMLNYLFQSIWIPIQTENIIHRVRPSRHDVDVYWFGYNIPESFKNLFNVKFF